MTVAMLALCLAVLATTLLAPLPDFLLVALLAVFALYMLVTVVETARFQLRRSARRRRLAARKKAPH